MPQFEFEVSEHISVEDFVEECSKRDIEKLIELLKKKHKIDLGSQMHASNLYDHLKLEILIDFYKNKTLEQLQQLQNIKQ